MRFVDTNVLVYAASTDARDQHKSSFARTLLKQRDLALSVQVLQEFYVQVTRATRSHRLSHDDAVSLMLTWQRFRVQDLTLGIVMNATTAAARWQISYWDAAILESARAAGCDTVLSEDLQHGQNFGGVQVLNPFR